MVPGSLLGIGSGTFCDGMVFGEPLNAPVLSSGSRHREGEAGSTSPPPQPSPPPPQPADFNQTYQSAIRVAK